jgi:sec-independent protein translocase protein TatA
MGDFFGLGTSELLLIGIIAVLLFGKNLPEVGRKVGKYLGEFRKSVQNIQREIDSAGSEIASAPAASKDFSLDREETTAPKFEPPV